MATYTKKLKTLTVHLMLDSEPVTIADTATDNMGTRALNEFKKYDTMHYETVESDMKITNAIPYHAVQYIEVTESDGTVTREDPYGCDEGGGEAEVWYTGTLSECGGGVAQAYLAETDKANTADIIANHESYLVSLNGIELEYAGIDGDAVMYSDTGSYQNYNVIAFLATENATVVVKCPTDMTTVEVTVAHK